MEAAAILKGSTLFLGNDGGLVHLAASQDIPIIAFYGPTDPNVYGAYPGRPHFARLTKGLSCQPCYGNFRYNEACPEIACMSDFKPLDVVAELNRIEFFKAVV